MTSPYNKERKVWSGLRETTTGNMGHTTGLKTHNWTWDTQLDLRHTTGLKTHNWT